MSSLINIALFASGTGSNVQNIIRHFHAHPRIRVVLVVSNNAGSGAVQKAQAAGVAVLPLQKHELTNGEWMVEQLHQRNVHFVVLAGYLKMIPAVLANTYHGRMINIHPALLPKYGGKGMYGRYVHEAVKTAGDAETGITVHYVSDAYDEGEIIEQKKTAVLPADTVEDIENKVRQLEMEWFPVIIESVILSKTRL